MGNDLRNLLKIINDRYNIKANSISLHRDMIGYVYMLEGDKGIYVFKQYRSINTSQAMQSIQIISYLTECGYPIVSIVATKDGAKHIDIDTPEGKCVGILYDYIEGYDVDRYDDLVHLGEQVAWLHNLMESYNGTLVAHGKEFFIDRYINILHELSYNKARIDDIAQYGSELWKSIASSTPGFCHGDLHTANMFKMTDGSYTIYDFDVASYSHGIIDVAVLSDGSNFNKLECDALDKTRNMFDRFYRGYSKIRTLSDNDIGAIPSFVAARHYELIATIVECKGLGELSIGFLDQQYYWLMKWREMCEKGKQFK